MIQNLNDNQIYCGIYKIDFPNGKAYIGQSQNIEKRIKEHLRRAKKGSHGDKDIQLCEKAIAKYFNKISIDILEIIDDIALLDQRESYWIGYYKSNQKDFGYNLTSGGDVSNKRGLEHPNAKFTATTLNEVIKQLEDKNLSLLDIANNFGVDRETIRRINEGVSYTNPNIIYPIRKKNYHGFAIKDVLDYFQSEKDLISLKEDLQFRWDLTIEKDLVEKYNIPITLLRDINYGRKFSEIGDFSYPIRNKNVRNKNNLSQKDILSILNRLRNTSESMESIGKDFNFGRVAIRNINLGKTYPIKDYDYPARKTK